MLVAVRGLEASAVWFGAEDHILVMAVALLVLPRFYGV